MAWLTAAGKEFKISHYTHTHQGRYSYSPRTMEDMDL